MRLQLVTLSGMKFDEDVYEVFLPTKDGEIGVLPGHMPLMSVAKTGVIRVRRQPHDPDGTRELFAISGGIIEVENDVLKVIVDEADHSEDINESAEQEALARAKRMKDEAKDEVSLAEAQAMIDRTGARLEVASLKSRHQKR